MQGDGVASGEAGVRGPMPGGGTDVATRAGVPRCGGEGGARGARRQRVRELLATGWANRTGAAIAAEARCSRGTVYDVRRETREREERERIERGRKCHRCEFYEEVRNPVGEDGLCLWCRLEGQGVSLLEFHESGAAVELGFWEARR